MNANLSQSDYSRFRELVRQKSGLQLANYRLPDLVRVIEELAHKTGLSEPNSLYELLCQPDSTGRAALDQFIGALTVGESYFFRNRPHFDALEKKILPQLIESRQKVKRLRIWCAGCSTGEEPYSIGILLKRLLPDIARWKILILATDINREALQKARRGIYRAWSLRQVPSQIEKLYVTKQGTSNHKIRSDIRQMVTFSYLNLANDIYPSILNKTYGIDLILCRNVLIYFDQNIFKKVVGRLHNSLVDDGWLVVGHAEPEPEIFHQFKAHYFPRTIVYQKTGAEVAPVRSAPSPLAAQKRIAHSKPIMARQSAFVFEADKIARRILARPTPSPLAPHTLLYDAPADKTERLIPARLTSARPTPSPLAPRTITYDAPANKMERLNSARQQEKRLTPIQEALALWEAGQRLTALKQLEQVKTWQVKEPEEAYRVAKLYANQQQLKKANTWLNIVLRQAPLFAPAHYLQGVIYSEWGKLDDALTALRRALFADQQFILAHFALATLFGRIKQPKRAERSLNKVTQLLATCLPDAPISEGDKITAKELEEMVAMQRGLLKSQ